MVVGEVRFVALRRVEAVFCTTTGWYELRERMPLDARSEQQWDRK